MTRDEHLRMSRSTQSLIINMFEEFCTFNIIMKFKSYLICGFDFKISSIYEFDVWDIKNV